MERKRLMSVARRIFSLPTAPYAERHVASHLKHLWSGAKSVRIREDDFGNLIVRYKRGKTRGPILAFGAHMDHPGFEVTERIDERRVRAVYRGGGPEKLKGARVRIFSLDRKGKGVPARVAEVTRRKRPREVVLQLGGSDAGNRRVQAGDFTMYDFPAMQVKKDRVFTRSCDDTAAVIANVLLIDELIRRRVEGECIAFFTRAEEVGFHGAIAMAESGSLSRRAKVISLENSSALAGAKIGGGPVIRVGDRISIFDPDVTHFLVSIATELARSDKKFKYQRKLMDGGSCEATPFCAAGYAAGGLCLSLGNYHNIGPTGRPAPEYISLQDLDGLIEFMIACVRRRGEYATITKAPAKLFRKRFPAVSKALRQSK